MTKFTPKQLALLEKKIEFTEDGFNIVGDLPGNVHHSVLGNVGRNVWGSVLGRIGYGWVREEIDND